MKKKIYFLALLFPLLSGCDDFFAPNTDDTLLEKIISVLLMSCILDIWGWLPVCRM